MYVFSFFRPIVPLVLDQHYIAMKTQVIKAERRVLKELGFCVHVKHPHKIIVMYLQVLGFQNHKEFMQLSWNYMNDALRSDVFMRYNPETVACACIYLSSRYMNITLPKQPPWYGLFKVTEDQILDVCRRILLLYKRGKVNAEELEKKVEELKKQYQESRLKNRTTGASGNGSIVSGNNSPNSASSPNNRHNHGEKNKSRSPSRSSSRSPKHKRSKGHRGRSRSGERRSKKHRRRSYTPSPSPPRHSSKHSREKTRYRSRSRSPGARSGSYDKYYSSSEKKSRSKHRDSYEENRIRSRH